MEKYKLLSMRELGAVGDFDTLEIINFYNRNIYPRLDIDVCIMEIHVKDPNSPITVDHKDEMVVSICEKFNKIKSNNDPNYILRKLNSILDDMYLNETLPRIGELIDDIKNDIISFFENNGYINDYFLFKENSFMYNINANNIKIKYDVSQSGYVAPDYNELSSTIFKIFSKLVKEKYSMCSFGLHMLRSISAKLMRQANERGYEYIGWSRSELISALKESEYFEEHVEELQEDVVRKYVYKYPKFNQEYRVKFKRDLPILEYLTKFELELLYKYVNNNNSVNFRMLCKIPYIDDFTFHRMLDKFDPSFLNGKYKQLSVPQICDILGVNIIESIMAEIPELSQQILFQPGGKYFKNVESKYKDYMNISNKKELEIVNTYRKYLNNCEDPTIAIHTVVFDAIELGLIDKIDRNMSKEEICKIIKKYIETLYEKK